MNTQNNLVIKGIKNQRTYCMIKPDGVVRGLTGEIIRRIELSGLKIVALKMVKANKDMILKHYPVSDQSWVDKLGDKGLSTFSDLDLDINEFLGMNNKSEVGKSVADALVDYMTSAPIVCMIVEGVQAVDMVRKLAGHTLPFKADMGTIRGDFSVDSPVVANIEGRAIHNLFHTSETIQEAQNEINLWFSDSNEINYTRAGEDIMYSKTY
ncbi:MAG: nucleoside-diphosphate kinase [candidate division SR1 bacterium]|nr:nucleoside-diphosphate kinase [candidate division SR1 bacterium]